MCSILRRNRSGNMAYRRRRSRAIGRAGVADCQQTSNTKYDLVVIGARRTGAAGDYWRSKKTYEVIKAIQPPVLVAIGERKQLKRFVVCTGGKEFIERAVQFTGRLAAAVGASVTLLHVMAEPPAMYADLVRMEENVPQITSIKIGARDEFAPPERENSTGSACPLKCISATESSSIRCSTKCARAITT